MLFMESFSPDAAENQMEFFGLLPESAGFGRSHPKRLFRRVNRFSSRAFPVIRDSSFFRHFVIRISSFFGNGFIQIQQHPRHHRVGRELRRRRA